MRRPLWIVAGVVAAVFALANAASASVREECKSLAESVVATVDDPSTPVPDPSSSVDPSETPEAESSETPEGEPSETPVSEETPEFKNHGEEVSAVAKDKSAVGTRTLKNGKTIENHGAAVSAVANGKGGETAAHGKSSAR